MASNSRNLSRDSHTYNSFILQNLLPSEQSDQEPILTKFILLQQKTQFVLSNQLPTKHSCIELGTKHHPHAQESCFYSN